MDEEPNVYDLVLSKVYKTQELRSNADGWRWLACCPAHDDKNPSLSIGVSTADKSIMLNCHAGCERSEIISVLGLTEADLRVKRSKKEYKKKPNKKLEETYVYESLEGKPIVRLKKIRRPDGSKSIWQERYENGSWVTGTVGIEVPLYRLPEIKQALERGEAIWITEGEKDVDALFRFGLTATTNINGAGKWRAHHTEFLKGCDVVLIGDNDKPGYEHVRNVRDSLEKVDCNVRVMKATKGKDFSDHIKNGGDLTDLIDITDPHEESIQKIQEFIKQEFSEHDETINEDVFAIIREALDSENETLSSNGDNKVSELDATILCENPRCSYETQRALALDRSLKKLGCAKCDYKFSDIPNDPTEIKELIRKISTSTGVPESSYVRKTKDEIPTSFTPLDAELRERLKEWRLERSRSKEVPAFVIFNDETLNALATRKPQSVNELLEIKGIGKDKCERYGEEILNIINDFRGRY